ncbi:MAG TPA: class I SAM-dependent methyltransferase [Alphaproteobacteria bacterium]|nr:class I SAM-dependent methyltransferase [Alphaproteobacteria bacterium]
MATEKTKSAAEAYAEGTDYQFLTDELTVGPWTSYSILHDPKHLVFTLSRYKFVAKLLQGRGTVLEVGPGDGIGLPIIAQAVEKVIAVDWDERLIEGNKRRLKDIKNIEHLCIDLNKERPKSQVDAAFSIDVIEHLEQSTEDSFMRAMVRCLHKDGVLITGTPNITASQYASPRSEAQHINLKSMKTLQELTHKYCKNVFMFGMNDEVLHTGYAPMCHYIWSLGVGIREEYLD